MKSPSSKNDPSKSEDKSKSKADNNPRKENKPKLNLENVASGELPNLQKFDLFATNSELSNSELSLPNDYQSGITDLISNFRSSNREVNNIVKQCIDFIKLSDEGIDELNANRGFFNRIWGAINGNTRNQVISNENDLNNALKACVQIINELNKQFLISQTQILMLGNLIGHIIKEETDFRIKFIEHLRNIFTAVKNRFEILEKTIYDLSIVEKETRNIIQKLEIEYGVELYKIWERTNYLENYISSVEKQVETLEWLQLIDCYINPYDNFKENSLLLFFQIIIDFYNHKRGQFTFKDLLLLSVAIRKKLELIEEPSFTLDIFVDLYLEHIVKTKEYEVIDKFLCLDKDTRRDFKELLKSGYYGIDTQKSQFITILGVIHVCADHPELQSKDKIAEYVNNSKLQLDDQIDLFLIACEILFHKQLTVTPTSTINENKVLCIIKKKASDEDVTDDLVDLFFSEFSNHIKYLLHLNNELLTKLKRENFDFIEELMKEDLKTSFGYSSFSALGGVYYYEKDSKENLYTIGIYTHVSPEKGNIKIIPAISMQKNVDKTKNLISEFEKSNFEKINIYEPYDSFGKEFKLGINEDPPADIVEQISLAFTELIKKLVE